MIIIPTMIQTIFSRILRNDSIILISFTVCQAWYPYEESNPNPVVRSDSLCPLSYKGKRFILCMVAIHGLMRLEPRAKPQNRTESTNLQDWGFTIKRVWHCRNLLRQRESNPQVPQHIICYVVAYRMRESNSPRAVCKTAILPLN